MTMHSQIDIPPAGLSLGADIYRQYRRGEITQRDYHVFNAAMIASLSHEESPKLYLTMPGAAKVYVEGRLFADHSYDQNRARVLGQWRFDVHRALDHNVYIREHFMWALEKCQDAGLRGEAGTLIKAIHRFEAMIFPREAYLRACDVLKMDAEARSKS